VNSEPLDENLKRLKPFLVSDEEEIIESPIYHYCSIDSFMNIIKTGEIWASHHGSMNDSSESRLFYEVLYDIGQSKANSSSIDKINTFLRNFEINLKDYYIASFSKNPDILSQWYMYGNKGKGVCIGFNPESFHVKKHIPHMTLDDNERIGIFNVSYQNENQEALASDLIALVIEDLWNSTPPSIEKLSLAMKHKSFEQEKEVRIVEVQLGQTLMNPDVSALRTPYPGEHYSFRVKNENSIVSFRKFPFRNVDGSSVVHSIWLGPECKIDQKTLLLFLNGCKCALSDSFYRSSCPFRV